MSNPSSEVRTESRMLSEYLGATREQLPTPCLVLESEVLASNVRRVQSTMNENGVALRPHWKTSKTIETAMTQVAAGAIGLTAATAAELLALVRGGITDVFLAFPAIGRHRVDAVLDATDHATVTVGTDSLDAVTELAAAASTRGLSVRARLEVDTGLGRTGVRPDQALGMARALAATRGLELEGIYTHEGHVQSIGADASKRHVAGVAAGGLLVEVADTLRTDGLDIRSVSVGSTPSLASAPTVTGVTEARPGTYVFGDENQHFVGTARDEDCALSVAATVISTTDGRTIVDAGVKAMSSDRSLHGDGRHGTVLDKSGRATEGVISRGYEEHGLLSGGPRLTVGSVVRIRPNHACGVVNMHSHIFVVENGVVIDVWPVLGRH